MHVSAQAPASMHITMHRDGDRQERTQGGCAMLSSKSTPQTNATLSAEGWIWSCTAARVRTGKRGGSEEERERGREHDKVSSSTALLLLDHTTIPSRIIE
jgi:hypothetical protein